MGGTDHVTYKGLLLIIGSALGATTVVIIFFFQTTAGAQTQHMRTALDNQVKQLDRIIAIHSQSIHAEAVSIKQYTSDTDRLRVGIEINRNDIIEMGSVLLGNSQKLIILNDKIEELLNR